MKATTTLHYDESSSDIFHFCKKAAVHLNNTGVSLLHRGCLRQAIETFTDALAIAQLGCQHTKHNMVMNDNDRLASSTFLTPHDHSVAVKKILENAHDRLSHPEPPSTLFGLELEVISDNESPAVIQSRCLVEEEDKEDTESSVHIRKGNFIIHMNDLNIIIPSEEEDAIQCSIISYNYAMAYLCLSTLPASRPFVEQLYMGAFKMFQLSFSSLTSSHHDLIKENLPSHQMNRVLITSIMVLCNLILLSTTTLPGTTTNESAEYLEYLGRLKQSIDEFCGDFHCTISSPAAPAA